MSDLKNDGDAPQDEKSVLVVEKVDAKSEFKRLGLAVGVLLLLLAAYISMRPSAEEKLVEQLLTEADEMHNTQADPFREVMWQVAKLKFPVAVGLPTTSKIHKMACTQDDDGNMNAWLVTKIKAKDKETVYTATNVADIGNAEDHALEHCAEILGE